MAFPDPTDTRLGWGEWLFSLLCSVTSIVVTVPYLTFIMLTAYFHTMFYHGAKKDPDEHLTKAEKRLTRDLRFYINLAGFEFHDHSTASPDGFHLELGRICAKLSDEEKPRYPVLLLPGLMQHVGAYCTAGPDAMALALFRAGFDVWLGNTRSTFHPKNYKHWRWSTAAFNWGIDEMALIDVPTLIETVKKHSGSDTVAVVGHSQGTTQCFRLLSKSGRPDVCPSVSSFSALAPAVYAGPGIDRWYFKPWQCSYYPFRLLLGYRAFCGVMAPVAASFYNQFFTHMAFNMFHWMMGWSDKLWDRHYRDRTFMFSPSLVSAKLMFFWLGTGGFADTRCIFPKTSDPWFDDNFPPLALFTGGIDNLCDPKPLIARMKSVESAVDCQVFELDNYSHMDVLWAQDNRDRVTIPMGDFIWSKVPDTDKWRAPQWSIEPSPMVDPETGDVDLRANP